MKKAKKLFAIAATAAMLGATAGMAAADLSDYPAPFVEDGVLNAAIVVGATAATQDVLGSIDIAASLQSMAVTVEGGSTGTTVEGGEDFDDRYLEDTSLAYDVELDHNDLAGFVDDDFDQDGTQIDYTDYIVIYNGAIEFWGADGSSTREYYGNDIFMEVAEGSIQYIVELDKDFNFSNIGATDMDDSVEFKMLGKTITITGATATSITVEGSTEYYLEDGDSVTVDGHEITLVSADSGSALVEVDGQVRAITEGNDYDFDAGVEVKVESAFYRENSDLGFATLKIGESISETVASGDAATIFGQVDDDNEAEWVWNITLAGEGSPSYIGLSYNQDRLEVEDEIDTEDGELPALMVGQEIELPNNYAAIRFDSLVEAPEDMATLKVEVDDGFDLAEDDGNFVDNVWGVKFSTDTGSEDFVVGSTKTSEVWAVYNGTTTADQQLWYKDGDDETMVAGTTVFTLKLDDESIQIGVPVNTTFSNFSIVPPSGTDEIGFNATSSNDYFGSDEEEDANDLRVNGVNVGTADYEGGYFTTDYGIWFENPEDMFGTGSSFELHVPRERQYATVVVTTEGSSVSAGYSGYAVNSAGVGLGVLDTDAPSLGSKPMIVVGGPAVNTVAMELMGNPTYDELMETFSEGKALIRYYGDEEALLVAGWGALETQGAANVVAEYQNYDFAGDELEVVVTSLSDITVNPVN